MLDINITVNGRLVGHVHVLNVTDMNAASYGEGLDLYDYEYYEPEHRLRDGTVEHRRSDGVRPLLAAILGNMAFGDELDRARERAETPAPPRPASSKRRKQQRKEKRK